MRGDVIKSTRAQGHAIVHPLGKHQYQRVYDDQQVLSELNRTATEEDMHPHCRLGDKHDAHAGYSSGGDAIMHDGSQSGSDTEQDDGKGNRDSDTVSSGSGASDKEDIDQDTSDEESDKELEPVKPEVKTPKQGKKATVPRKGKAKIAQTPKTAPAPKTPKTAPAHMRTRANSDALAYVEGMKGTRGRIYIAPCFKEFGWPGAVHAASLSLPSLPLSLLSV